MLSLRAVKKRRRAVKKRRRARFGPRVSLLSPCADVSKTTVLGTVNDDEVQGGDRDRAGLSAVRRMRSGDPTPSTASAAADTAPHTRGTTGRAAWRATDAAPGAALTRGAGSPRNGTASAHPLSSRIAAGRAGSGDSLRATVTNSAGAVAQPVPACCPMTQLVLEETTVSRGGGLAYPSAVSLGTREPGARTPESIVCQHR